MSEVLGKSGPVSTGCLLGLSKRCPGTTLILNPRTPKVAGNTTLAAGVWFAPSPAFTVRERA
eukprot:2450840-Alexandrium_andersonii.AAC.1